MSNLSHPSTLIIGLGNPILGDDGVGWKVAEEVQSKIQSLESKIEVEFASLGGLSLMERMLGYDRVILIDSLETGMNPIGTVSVFPLEALNDPTAGHSASAHDTTLLTALKTAQAMGLDAPKSVMVVAIEAKNVYDFTEELSEEVGKAVDVAAEEVMRLAKK